MAVAKLKPAPVDPSRQALVDALADLKAAKKAVDDHNGAVRKCWGALREAEAAAAKAEQGITASRIEAAGVLASAMVDEDDVVAPPNTVALARAAYTDAVESIANLKAARDELRRTLPHAEQTVRDCEGAVEAAISEIERPVIAQVTAMLQELIVRAEPLRKLLAEVGTAYSSRTIGWPGVDAVKVEVEAAGQTAFKYFTNDAYSTTGIWAKRRAMLRDDPFVVLPDPLAPALQPPPAA
jgi:hypothetical protein